jgi:hypothetical protein
VPGQVADLRFLLVEAAGPLSCSIDLRRRRVLGVQFREHLLELRPKLVAIEVSGSYLVLVMLRTRSRGRQARAGGHGRAHRRVPDHREISMPPFRQLGRTGPGPRAGTMSTFALGQIQVRRSGYGAMQLAGPYAFGPPPDRATAIGVLRAAVAAGVDHIDTAQYYGPGMVNGLIRDAL